MVCVGCIQNFLMGGVIFGWAAISNTMLVSTDSGAPGLSASRIHEMFVMASSANMCSPLFLGVVLDRKGPRACSCVSILFSVAGFALFGLAGFVFQDGASNAGGGGGNGEATGGAMASLLTKEGVLTASMVLIGFGGPGVQNAVIHLANLFPARKGLVTAIITGCFQLSFCVFFIFDQLWFFGGLEYSTIFLTHSAVCLLCLAASVVLWPDAPFQFDQEVLSSSPATRTALEPAARAYSSATDTPPRPLPAPPSSLAMGQQQLGLIRFPSTFQRPPAAPSEAAAAAGGAVQTKNERTPILSSVSASSSSSSSSRLVGLKQGSLATQLMSEEFVSATLLLTVASFWANFYIGAVDLQLADESFLSPEEQAAAMRSFTIITVLGVLGIPFVGYSMDHLGFRTTLIITVTLGCVWSAMTLVRDPVVLTLSFGVYALFRTFTFNYYFAFLADRLGFRYFGVLAGCSFCVAGVAGLVLQGPLLEWGHSPCLVLEHGSRTEVRGEACGYGRWGTVNSVKLGTMALLYALPLRRRLYKIGGAIARTLSG